MRQPSIHHLQGQLLALQAQLNAVLASMPVDIRASVQEHLQRQADLARVDIISTEWSGPVMPGFEDQLALVLDLPEAASSSCKSGRSPATVS